MDRIEQFETAAERPARAITPPRGRVLSVSDQVTESLRDMIFMGELAGGQQITHDQIAEALDVSTMPVREALLRLTHEGLIEGGAKARSFRVSTMNKEDVRDIYWLHAQLAGELTARAALRLDEDGIAALKEAHQEWLAAERAADSLQLEAANNKFHRIINRGADSPKLARFLLHTLRLIPHQYYSLVPQQVRGSTKAHAKIMDAIIARDAESARAAAQKHVLDSANELIKHFDERGFWVPASEPGATRRVR